MYDALADIYDQFIDWPARLSRELPVLTAWLGGPRDWFVENPGVCMMSAHARIPVTAETAAQWSDAMGRAIADSDVDPAIGAKMAEALASMAQGMIRRAGEAA